MSFLTAFDDALRAHARANLIAFARRPLTAAGRRRRRVDADPRRSVKRASGAARGARPAGRPENDRDPGERPAPDSNPAPVDLDPRAHRRHPVSAARGGCSWPPDARGPPGRAGLGLAIARTDAGAAPTDVGS